jgi:hypothetical protein
MVVLRLPEGHQGVLVPPEQGQDLPETAEAAHAAPNDVIFSQSFAPSAALAVTGLTVERGTAERSFIEYLDIAFNEAG